MNPLPRWDALLQSVLFAPLHPLIVTLRQEGFPTLDDLNRMLAVHQPSVASGCKLSFVAQGAGRLAFESQYEPRCYLTGEVQTRQDNWHDLLNALVWLTYPNAKAAINVRHFQALTQGGLADESTSQRGAVRDTSTLFDESGVIVACADEELAGLLQNFRWRELFWQRRQAVRERMGFYIFGHGLYEKALQPYIGMTGQGLLLPVAQEFFRWTAEQQRAHLDRRLADYLAGACRTTRELSPVPLLGVPGWSADNESESYYDNTAYFRPGRQR
ncbi:MAG: DUF3025 domain-containing protein [Gallionella sp.]|nr:DUF3025 domain-containing protein [Gallionella sp.]